MAKLVGPLKSTLDEGYTEADLQRMWRGVQVRSARRSMGVSQGRWLVGGASLAVAAAVVVAVFWPRHPTVEPLPLVGGGLPALFESSGGERRYGLADGSAITLGPGARIEVLSNDGSSFSTVLRRGRATFDVHPGGPRRWTVEGGLATVEVVGTEFTLERGPDRLAVAVSRGVVLVRGERVPDRVQKLVGGSQLVVHGREAAAPSSPQPVPSAVVTPSAAPSANRGPPSPSGSELDRLMQRADRARRAGDPDTACALLEQAVREAGSDPRGSLAALTLARITMARAPERAERALSAVLKAGAARGLEEDVLARLVEARARMGDASGARDLAGDYQQRFPNGAHRAEVERWAAE
jgi:transmembrane sensor